MARLIRKNTNCCPPVQSSCNTVDTSCSSKCTLYTGDIKGSDFTQPFHLVSSDVELISVDNNFFKMENITANGDCGNIFNLPVSNGSNITFTDLFKSQLELITKEGKLEQFIKNLFNSTEFKQWFSNYFISLVSGGHLDICNLIENCGFSQNTAPTLKDLKLGNTAYGGSFEVTKAQILALYSDVEGDTPTHIKVVSTGTIGSLTSIPNGTGYIPLDTFQKFVANMSNETHLGSDRVAKFTIQIKNSAGQETNVATISSVVTAYVNKTPILTSISKESSGVDNFTGSITKSELLSKYSDPENDTVTHIKLLGDNTYINLQLVNPTGNNTEFNQWIAIDRLNSINFALPNDITKILQYQFKNSRNQETNMATITLRNAKIPDSETRCVCLTGNQTVTLDLNYNQDYKKQVGTVTYKNSCNTDYTINRTIPSNIPGLTFKVEGRVTANSNSVAIPVYVSGRANSTTQGQVTNISGTLAQSCSMGSTFNITLSGTIRNPEDFASCIRINDGSNYNVTDSILRNTSTNKQIGSLKFTNNCGTTITIPEQVFFNSNGLKVYIPSFQLPQGSVNKTITVSGTYSGTLNQITGNITIGGIIAKVILNVTNPDTAPTASDVTKTLANRTNYEITSRDLIWNDAEGDSLQAVKFTEDVSRLFINEDRTTAYVAGTELPHNFTIFFKAPDQDAEAVTQFNYFVKAGGKWSN